MAMASELEHVTEMMQQHFQLLMSSLSDWRRVELQQHEQLLQILSGQPSSSQNLGLHIPESLGGSCDQRWDPVSTHSMTEHQKERRESFKAVAAYRRNTPDSKPDDSFGLKRLSVQAPDDWVKATRRSRSSLGRSDEVKPLKSRLTFTEMEDSFLEVVTCHRRSEAKPMKPPVPPSPLLPGQAEKEVAQISRLTSPSEVENLGDLSHRATTQILEQVGILEDPPLDLGSLSQLVPRCLLCLLYFLSLGNAVLYVICVSSMGSAPFDGLAVIASCIFSVCAALSCSFLRDALQSSQLRLTMNKLYLFAQEFREDWERWAQREKIRSVAFWLLWVVVFIGGQVLRELLLDADDESRPWRYALRGLACVCWSMSSLLVILEAYAQNHLLHGLSGSLDCWCCFLLECPDFGLGVDSWNCLQALLKCIGRQVEKSFLVMQILSSIGCVYCLASAVVVAFLSGFQPKVMLSEGAFLLPVLMLFFLEMRVFFRGTGITEKCRLVPAFVNQIPAAQRMNEDRSYLVRFITDSSAGFFVRDVKLTKEMLLKTFMITGGILSGLLAIISRI